MPRGLQCGREAAFRVTPCGDRWPCSAPLRRCRRWAYREEYPRRPGRRGSPRGRRTRALSAPKRGPRFRLPVPPPRHSMAKNRQRGRACQTHNSLFTSKNLIAELSIQPFGQRTGGWRAIYFCKHSPKYLPRNLPRILSAILKLQCPATMRTAVWRRLMG